MKHVPNETYIPGNDAAKIRSRLIEHINSMSDAEIRIKAKSEASLRAFITDLFRDIARIFGYIVSQVVGFGRDLVKAIGDGWSAGWEAGING